MGFDFEKDKSFNGKQLSLFDTPSNTNASTKATAEDLNMWLMAHREPEQSKTSRFMTLSATLHLAAILATAFVTVPLVEQAKTETITIEIQDVPQPKKEPRGAFVSPTQGGTPIAEKTPVVEKLDKVKSPGNVFVAEKPKPPKNSNSSAKAIAKSNAKPKPSALATKLPPKQITKTIARAKATATATASPKISAHGVSAKTTFKAVPLSIDDIEAPQLDSGDLSKTVVASNLNEDFDDDFSKVNKSHSAAVEAEKKSMDAMADALENEQNENLNALDKANEEEDSRLAAIQNSVHKKNADNIASALSAEKAAAAAAAVAAAEREAARKAKQNKGGLGGQGQGFGTNSGAGAGNNGDSGYGTQIAGLPKGVRSLDQLRQMPGNQRPQYDREERRRGDQGEIAFIAYISREGYPTKFQLIKSTGYRNLDSKTLAALKKWRFYPGQEGWVELPFRWDLKGGVQQDGGLLRRSVSSR